ncbi:MAG TPA: BadF/BadG/BcrA/BcrD ATPase family protein [Streptosporangiaceae bacterium]
MTEPLPAALAVDGGNSKTDVALIGGDGTVLALVRGPGMPIRLGEPTVSVIAGLIREAADLAGRPATDGPVADCLVACVANVDLPAEVHELERMLTERRFAGSTQVANDTFAVLRGGLDDVPAAGAARFWGVGVTCGAGINCIAVAPDGSTAGFLALGMTTGDWGGGMGLGMEAQWYAVRAADGRGPRTVLQQTVPAYFGLSEPLQVAEGLHVGQIPWDKVAGLAPLVLQAADAGDQVARNLVLRLADEIYLLVKSSVTRLGLGGQPVPVVLGGGVLASGNDLLIGTITRQIGADFPAAEVRVLRQPPVAGAALLGLDAAGAPVSAKQRLRAAFARRLAPLS